MMMVLLWFSCWWNMSMWLLPTLTTYFTSYLMTLVKFTTSTSSLVLTALCLSVYLLPCAGLGNCRIAPIQFVARYMSSNQCRCQDLLRGGAELEIRSWGTHSGLQSRMQQLLDVLWLMQYWSKELRVVDICTSWSRRLHNTWIVGQSDLL